MNFHLSNDRLISHHRSRNDYQQSPENSLTFAYGDHRYVKFTYELLNQHDILKLKILKQLIEDFSLCQNIDLAIKCSDILSVLLKHLNNSNEQIRLLSMTAIKKMCASSLGRRTIILKDCILEIEKLINDKITQIRQNCYQALIDFAELTDGIQCLLKKNTILTDLVDKLVQQKSPQILNRAIILLRNLMQGQQGTPKALKTQIISRLMNILGSSNPQIQTNILQTLANISFNYDGKQQIILKNHIKQLCTYVNHKTQSVRQAICLVLCSLSQLNEGKIQILQFCQFQSIIERLNDDPATVLNAVQLIANLAENPLGREKSIAVIKKIENVKNIQKKYVDATLDVIRWKP